MTTFFEAGFTSDETRESIPDLIAANGEWFGLLTELVESLQKTAIKACEHVKGSPFDKLPLSLLVLHRANGQIQGAVTLLERGMVVEARTLLRSFLESAFVMAGIHDNYETVKTMMIADMDAAKKGQANVIVKQGLTDDPTLLQERIKEFGKGRGHIALYPRAWVEEHLQAGKVMGANGRLLGAQPHRRLRCRSLAGGWPSGGRRSPAADPGLWHR